MLIVPDEAPIAKRPDLLVHALAQLPDDVELQLSAGQPRDRIVLLATAYGVEQRLHFEGGSPRAAEQVFSAAADTGSMAELLDALGPAGGPVSRRRGRDELFAEQRIAILTNLPTHYRVPLLNAMSERLAAAGASLRVFFTAARPWARSWMAPVPLQFDHEFLRSVPVPLGMDLPFDLERQVQRFAPTLVLVPGFSPAVAVRAAAAARWMRVPYGIWSGEIPAAPSAKSGMRRRQRQALLRRATFAISYGHLSAEFLAGLASQVPVVYGRNTTPILVRPARRADDDAVIEILAVAQAIRRKRLDVAVAAFEHLRDLPCRLTVIGDGEELAALKQSALALDNIRFLGAVPSDRTLQAYSEASIFLFPTEFDVFGLVLVEAMGAGLAPVVSQDAGAISDLALPGRNCALVDGHDPRAWAAAIRALVENPQRRRTMGEMARQTVLSRWTMEHAVDAMLAGLRLGVLAGGTLQRPGQR